MRTCSRPWVHGKMSCERRARRHMDDINEWESMLADNDVVILKFFLHISPREQTRRLQARIDKPNKHWKLSPVGLRGAPVLGRIHATPTKTSCSHTSHKHAPWFVIPADHKWYRNVAISTILVEAMQGLKLKYPEPTFDPSGIELADETPQEAAREVEKKMNPAS